MVDKIILIILSLTIAISFHSIIKDSPNVKKGIVKYFER